MTSTLPHAQTAFSTPTPSAVTKILVANRGEVAVRVIRTARDMGVASVAVYSDQDMHSQACDLADEAYSLGGTAPAKTYLSPEALLAAATQSGADAIHPGYGFLSENADFAQAVTEAGITWLGPSADAIRALGDKISARNIATSVDVPVIPGEELTADIDTARTQILAIAKGHDFPVLVKRADAGGGRGITRLDSTEDVDRFLQDLPGAEALQGCFVEKMVTFARHVETQCMRDAHGNFAVVTTRDCSVQRRNQKVVEEAPAPHLSTTTEKELRSYSNALFQAVNYVGVGTCEYLVTRQGRVYFLEVNPRLQVEHTVSEEVTGVDLVREQIRIARGEVIVDVPQVRGHSFEVRITSENPADDLMPATGTITSITWPGGPGVRVDSFIRSGDSIGSDYDSLIAKLIVTGPTRQIALSRLVRAIDEFKVRGLPTCTPLLTHILTHPDFCGPDVPEFAGDPAATTTYTWPVQAGNFAVYTKWMEDLGLLDTVKEALVAAEPVATTGQTPATPVVTPTASAEDLETFVIEINGQRATLRLPQGMLARPAATAVPTTTGGIPIRPQTLRGRGRNRDTGSVPATAAGPSLHAPIQATVVRTVAEVGVTVAPGDLVLVLESMKMEKPITAQASGVVRAFHVGAGDTVKAGDLMVTIEPVTDTDSDTQEAK